MRVAGALRPALLAAFTSSAALSAAGFAYQYTEAGHGAGLEQNSALVLAVDGVGVFLSLLFAAQLFAAYRLFAARPAGQFRMHRSLALAVIALMALHGAGATAHAFAPPVEVLPVQLVAIGGVAALGLTAQVATGFLGLHRREPRRVHRIAVVVSVLVVVAHVALGTFHAITG